MVGGAHPTRPTPGQTRIQSQELGVRVVSEEEFDGVVSRLQAESVPYGSDHDGTYDDGE